MKDIYLLRSGLSVRMHNLCFPLPLIPASGRLEEGCYSSLLSLQILSQLVWFGSLFSFRFNVPLLNSFKEWVPNGLIQLNQNTSVTDLTPNYFVSLMAHLEGKKSIVILGCPFYSTLSVLFVAKGCALCYLECGLF